MLDRPDECPFCGAAPAPDYLAVPTPDGTVYHCAICKSIVYVVPEGDMHHHKGKVHVVPKGGEFVPPPGLMVRMDLGNTMPSDLFSDVVDK